MTSPHQSDASAQPSFSDDDIDSAIAVLQQDLEGTVLELFTLTDEELLAVDGVQHPQMTELPWVKANADNPELHKLIAAVAMRSLLARGVITSSADEDPEQYTEGSTTPLSFDAVPELRGVATLRRIPEAFVLVQRRTAAGNAASYFYVFETEGQRRVLWESYDAAGMHTFHLVPSELIAAQIRAFLDPESGIGDTDEDPTEVPADGFETSAQAAELADARAVSTVAVASVARETTTGFTTFALRDRLVLMETDGNEPADSAATDTRPADAGAADAGPTDAVHRLGAVSESTLTGIIEEVITAAMPEQSA